MVKSVDLVILVLQVSSQTHHLLQIFPQNQVGGADRKSREKQSISSQETAVHCFAFETFLLLALRTSYLILPPPRWLFLAGLFSHPSPHRWFSKQIP